MKMVEQREKAPLSNKGANAPNNLTKKTPRYAVCLDWFRYTYKHNPTIMTIADCLRVALPRDAAFQLTGEVRQNAKGYDSSQALTIGVIHWHSKIPSQGISVELSGSALSDMRKAGVSEAFLLQHVADLSAQVSTMDAALDIYDGGGSQRDFIKARDRGTLRTQARHMGEFSGAQKVKGAWLPDGTVYVGSPKSPVGMTIYDKAREQGLIGVDWIRIEMTWRGRHARAVHLAMVKFGIPNTLREAIKSMASINDQWYKHAMVGGLSIIEPVRRLETDTDKWLLEVVLPVLERRMEAERAQDDSKLLSAYKRTITQEERARNKFKPSQR